METRRDEEQTPQGKFFTTCAPALQQGIEFESKGSDQGMTGSKGGAPAGNQNAAAHGLYARGQLTRRVTLPERVEIPALAEYAQTLGDAALAIAQGLLGKM